MEGVRASHLHDLQPQRQCPQLQGIIQNLAVA